MAIAFDAASGGTGFVVNSVTWSHTCTGSNLILLVSTSYFENAADSPSGVTYNSVAMTKALDYQSSSLDTTHSLWFLYAPATGAHNVVVTFPTNRNNIACCSASYTGAAQSGAPDATATGNHGFGSSDLTIATTTVADNCWVVEVCGTSTNTVSMSAGTGATERTEQATTGGYHAAFYDGGPKTPAGSYSMTVAISAASNVAGCTASFAPAGGGGAAFIAGKPVELLQAVKRANFY